MVKTPHTRHSATPKDPVTIDLAPGDVSRVKADADKTAAEAVKSSDSQPKPAAAAGPKTAVPGAGAKASDAPAKDPQPTAETKKTDATAAGAGPAKTGDAKSSGSAAAPTSAKPASASPAPAAGDTSKTFGRQEPHRPAPEPVRSGGGMVAGGVAGGVIALLVAGGLQYSGILGANTSDTDQTAQIAALETQIAELRTTIDGLGAGDTAGLGERITAADERVAALTSDVATLRSQVEQLAAAAGQPDSAVDLAPIEERIAALETAIAGLGGSANPEAALAALGEQLDTLRSDITAAREGQTAAGARIDAVEQALATLTQRVDQQAEAPATAIIIAASALKAAIDRGSPFMTELETYASLAPDAPEVAELRDMAASGVPTRAQIAAEADAAANAMIGAARPVDPQAGIIDRLWASAMGLVQVRPIGMVEGEGVPEIAARIDAAVAANDYERAIAEYETLPETAKAASSGFIAKVRARHTADRLIDQALAAALKA